MHNAFFKVFYEVYDVNFPKCKINKTKKSLKSPWVTKDLRKSSKIKQKLYIKYLKAKTIESKTLYKTFTKLFENKKKTLKRKYYSDLFDKYKNDYKRKWQLVNEITCNNKIKICSLQKAIKINTEIFYSLTIIANEINKFFVSVGPNLAKNIPIINNSIDSKKDLTSPEISSLNKFKVSFDEFEIAFKMLKTNKAIGPDDVNGNIVIGSYDIIKNILFRVFTCSISQAVFPDKLKIARVTPIFKGGELTNLSHYRPISVLPVFSKILERILYNKIFKHLSENKILYNNQYGFKKNNSAEHAILQLTRNIGDSFETSQYTLGIFIDLSKAFDTIDHEILYNKLEHYRITGNTLLLLRTI
ncbi:uncharacterized protein LOC136086128 [Hydra vulgaris]|uniref:Uncharacterized protein LOC136086128 n=1 Tax=Hydra vulgaris TaxID=6087 RepID=A0ABM4CRH0_HYDVU